MESVTSLGHWGKSNIIVVKGVHFARVSLGKTYHTHQKRPPPPEKTGGNCQVRYFDDIIHQFYQYFTYFLYLYYIFDLFFMFILYILLLFLSCYYTHFTYYFRLCRANTHFSSYYFILLSYFGIFFHLFYQ